MPDQNKKDTQESNFLKQYFEYNTLLRNWFVVLGVSMIGAITLDKGFFENICISQKKTIITLILVAIFSQVITCLINKWHNFLKENSLKGHNYGGNRFKRVCCRIVINLETISDLSMIIINILVDTATIVLYLIAALIIIL